MACQRKKTSAQRREAEARRRRHDAGRIAEQRQQDRLTDLRRTLAAAARLAAALAVTDEFEWKPWGYEIAPPEPRHGRGLTVRHLQVVASNPGPRARDRFATPTEQARLAQMAGRLRALDRALAQVAA